MCLPPLRLSPAAVPLLATLAVTAAAGPSILAGCARTFAPVKLEPVPHVPVLSGSQPYAQVRELDLDSTSGFLTFSSPLRIAVTIDVLNRTAATMTIDVARSSLVATPQDGGTVVKARPAASGAGAVPARLEGVGSGALSPVILQPGEGRTIWIAFESLPSSDDPAYSVRLATSGAEPMQIVLHQPSTPRWRFPARTTGLGLRFDFRGYGSGGDGLSTGLTLTQVLGSFRLGLAGTLSKVYERQRDVFSRADVAAVECSLSWRPASWKVGFFGAGELAHMQFDQSVTAVPDRWSPALTVGLETPWSAASIPLLVTRVGYTRVLDDRAAQPHSLVLTFDMRLTSW